MKRTYTIFTNEDERIITAPSLGKAICRAYRDHNTCKVAEKGSVPVARLWAPETPSEGRPYIVAPFLGDEDFDAINSDAWVRYAYVEGLMLMAEDEEGASVRVRYDQEQKAAIFAIRLDMWDYSFRISCGCRQYESAEGVWQIYRLGRPQGLTRRMVG